MFLAFIWIICSSGQYISFFGDMQNPADIYWPEAWVPNNIELSTNHEGSDIFFKVHCRIFIDLPHGTAASLHLPYPEEVLRYYIDSNVKAGEDMELTFGPRVLNKGVYGPISLIIRKTTFGKIFASRAAFGEIAVIGRKPSTTYNLTVSFSQSSSLIITEASTLNFYFELNSQEQIEKYDYFIIELDTSFGYNNGKLSWDQSFEDSVLFTNTAIDTYDDNKIIIYGLQNSVPANTRISFSISGFKNPKNSKNAYRYDWTLSIYRFGTPTLLKVVKGSGPGNKIHPGTIRWPSWNFVNGYINKSEAHEGLVVFMKLNFQIEHDIPENGKIYVDFSGVDIDLYDWKPDDHQSLHSGKFIFAEASKSNAQLSCDITDSKSSFCTVNFEMIPRTAFISIYNLVKFNGDASVIRIKSMIYDIKELELKTIDEINYSNLYAETYIQRNYDYQAIGSGAISYFTKSRNEVSEVNQAGDYGSYGLVLSILNLGNFNYDDEVSVMLPFKIGNTPDLKKVVFEPEVYGLWSSESDVFNDNTFSIQMKFDIQKCEEGLISFNLKRDYSYGEYINIYLLNNQIIYLPMLPVTEKDMYELVIKVKARSNHYTYYLSKPINFVVSTKGTFAKHHFCLAADIPGLPVKISFNPRINFRDIRYEILIIFDFFDNVDNGFGSGLDNGSVYPSIGDYELILNDNTLSIKLNSLEYNPSIPDEENFKNFIIPFQSLDYDYYYYFDATVYAVSDTEKIIISKGSFSENYLTSTTYNIVSDSLPTNGYKFQTDITKVFTSSLDDNDQSGDQYDYSIIVALDKGLKFTLKNINLGGVSVLFQELSSENSMFNYEVGYINSINLADDALTYFTIFFTASWTHANNPQRVYLAYIKDNKFGNNICENLMAYELYFDRPKLKFNYFSPSQLDGYTLENPTAEVSISFTFDGTIYAGFRVNVYFSNQNFNHYDAIWSIKIGVYILETYDCSLGSACTSGRLNYDVSDSSVTITLSNMIRPAIFDYNDNLKSNNFDYVFIFNDRNDYGFDNIIYEWIHSEDAADGEDETKFLKPSSSASAFNIIDVWAFPSVKGSVSVYFGISFYPPFDLPPGTEIIISGEDFQFDPNAADNIWSSCEYYYIEIYDNKLRILISSDIPTHQRIDITKDLAFNLSSINDQSAKFFITVKYGGNTIIDMSNSDAGKSFTIHDTPNAVVENFIIVTEISNQGAKNFYNFTFSLDSDINSSWTYCFDASKEYDAHPGEIFTFEGFNDIYFLNAKSSFSTKFFCIVDHWVICCKGFDYLSISAAHANLYIIIFLTNPASDSASWNFYIIDDDMISVVKPYYNAQLEFTSIPNNKIDIYYVEFNYTEKDEFKSDVEMNVLINAYFDENSYLYVKFPYPFELELYNSFLVRCSAKYGGDYDDEYFIVPSKCDVEGNYVKFIIEQDKLLNNNYWTTLIIEDIVIPQSGFKRNSLFDEEFMYYDNWTGKFSILLLEYDQIKETQLNIFGQSYANINAAFTGFQENDYETLIINKGKIIEIYTGTYSTPISITVQTSFNAHNLTLTPRSFTKNILHFDQYSYYLDLNFPQATFKIGTSSKTIEGFYYISWFIKETPLIKGEKKYLTPPHTKVQVFNSLTFEVITPKYLFVSPNITSIPYPIFLDKVTPYNNLKIHLDSSPSNDYTIIFTPNSVIFNSEENLAYFTIKCEDCAIGNQYDILYQISGDDANSFYVETEGFFTAGSSETMLNASISVEIISQKSASVVISATNDAIVYWALLSSRLFESDYVFSSLEMIKKVAKPLVKNDENNDGITLEKQEKKHYKKIASLDQDGYSWDDYCKVLYINAENTYFANIDFVKASNNQILYTFNSLLAETEYTIIAYIDNNIENSTLFLINSFSTSSLPYHAKIKISFDCINEIDLNKTMDVMSNIYKCDRRRLSSTKVSYRELNNFEGEVMLFSNPLSDISPFDIAKNNQENLKFPLIIAGVPVHEVHSAEVLDGKYDTPYFENPIWNDDKISYVNFSFWSTDKGIACWVLDFKSNYSHSAFEVLIGLNRDGKNYSIAHECIDVNNIETFSFEYWFTNEMYGEYVFSSAICNNYPVLPNCINDLQVYEFSWINTTNYSLFMFLTGLVGYLI